MSAKEWLLKIFSCVAKLRTANSKIKKLEAELAAQPLNDPEVAAAFAEAQAIYSEMETSGDV